jgi:hypothetical protein
MRRPLLARFLSSLFALWFAVVVGDPGVLHACPEHGGHAGHGSAHSAHQRAGGEHGKAPATTGGCTCIGSCCAAPSLAPLPEIASFTVSTAIVPAVSTPEYPASAPASLPERLLPFANGPPQA